MYSYIRNKRYVLTKIINYFLICFFSLLIYSQKRRNRELYNQIILFFQQKGDSIHQGTHKKLNKNLHRNLTSYARIEHKAYFTF